MGYVHPVVVDRAFVAGFVAAVMLQGDSAKKAAEMLHVFARSDEHRSIRKAAGPYFAEIGYGHVW